MSLGRHITAPIVSSMFGAQARYAHECSTALTRRSYEECLKNAAPLFICECWESLLQKQAKRCTIIFFPCDVSVRVRDDDEYDSDSMEEVGTKRCAPSEGGIGAPSRKSICHDLSPLEMPELVEDSFDSEFE